MLSVSEQVVGGCSTGRPTFPHATKTSQTATHVTYSCDTDYAFPDGTLQKTVECGCENAMLVHGCHCKYTILQLSIITVFWLFDVCQINKAFLSTAPNNCILLYYVK